MSPEEIRSIRERLGLTQVEAGKLLGGGPRAFTKYESGTVEPAASVINLLRVLDAQPDAIATLGGAVPRRGAGYRPLPFEVGGEDIERLSYATLPELLRRLLHAEALAHGLPQDGIHVAGDINTPDGGEDGRIEWEGGPDRTTFLPARHCLFQTKAGEIAPVQAAREILKPAVRHGISIGGSYIVMCGHRYVHQLIDRRRARMCDALRQGGLQIKDDQIHFRDADQIAAWANHHPAVSMWVKEHSQPNTVGPFRSWSDWAGSYEHDLSPWVEDERLTELTVWLRERVTTERGVARLVGPWGTGKTRLTLEALRACGCNPIVMYAVDSECGPHNINETVQNLAGTGKRAIMVVDECSLDRHRVLTSMVLRDSSRLSLITIYDESSDGTGDYSTLLVSKAPDSVTEAIVGHVAPTLHSVDERRIAQFSKGFPRIASSLAERWGTVAIACATHRDLVDTFVLGRSLDERDVRLRSAQLIATFGLIQVEPSSDCQFNQIAHLGRNLTAQDFRFAVSPRFQQGAVQRQGKYVVIQPHTISLSLAERQWNEWNSDTWDEVLTGAIPSGLRVSAARQLALLNDTEIARRVTMHVCRTGGPLDLRKIVKPGHLEVLSILSEVLPESIAKQIERSLDECSPSQISSLVCPELVRALRKIAFSSQTFLVGARLLMRLAVADERISGSMSDRLRRVFRGGPSGATNAFQSLFSVLLGNTAADGTVRLALLDELVETDDMIQRSIVANALIEGLRTSNFSRQVDPEIQGSSPALTEWCPANQEEFDRYIEGCLDRLGRIAAQGDRIGGVARAGLARNISSLVSKGYFSTVEKVVRQVAMTSQPWTEALNSLGLLACDTVALGAAVASRIRKLMAVLRPTTLESRVRAHITHMTWDHTINGNQFLETPEHHERRLLIVKQLADEAVGQPAAFGELLAGLSRGRQSMAFEFGRAVADCDKELLWLDRIVRAAKQSHQSERNYDLLAGYVAAISKCQPDAVAALKRDAAKSIELAPCFPRLCLFIGISPEDIHLVMKAFEDRLLHPRDLKRWRIRGALENIPEAVVAPLFNLLIELSAEAFEVAIELIDAYINDEPRRVNGLRRQISFIAKNSTRWSANRQNMTFYHFERLMNHVLAKGRRSRVACSLSLELSKALIKADRYGTTYLIEHVLPTLLSDFPEISWPLIGNAIVSQDGISSRMGYILRRPPFGDRAEAPLVHLSQDTLFAWCYSHPDHAPVFAVRNLPILAHGHEDVVACVHHTMERLLIEFGDRDDVEQAFKENIDSLGWFGSEAAKYAQFERPLESLGSHNITRVREFSVRVLKYLCEQKKRAMGNDDERSVRAELSH